MSAISFSYAHPNLASPARLGRLTTPHGIIETPAIVVTGAQAALQSLLPPEVAGLGAQAVLCSTYHLALRPGPDIVADHGGLHRFMGWNGPLFTDSGGHPVFSLGPGRELGVDDDPAGRRRAGRSRGSQARIVTVDDTGVTYRSYLDGSTHRLTPESSIQLQEHLGADITTALDEPTALHDDEARTARAFTRAHIWAEHALAARTRTDQALYGVVQGSPFQTLREARAKQFTELPFDGFTITAPLGSTGRRREQAVAAMVPLLPDDRPRHVSNVGGLAELFRCVTYGADTADAAFPVRQARRGILLTTLGPLTITKPAFREDDGPVDPACDCPTCETFSRAYLRHLFKAEELLAATLAVTHNLAFILNLLARIRRALAAGALEQLRTEILTLYAPARHRQM